MGDLTKNFSRHEFACKCGCGFDTVDYELLTILQKLANDFSEKYNCRIMIIISSGCRCREYNEKIQKKVNPNYKPYSSRSQHILGRAADFKVFKIENNSKIQIPPKEIRNYLEENYKINRYGLGLYKTFVHFDTRTNGGARWSR